MTRITIAATFIVLMIFTTVAFGGQQSAGQQITLSIGSFTVSADQLSYDSDSGLLKASGNVTLEIKDHLKVASPDSVEINIDRAHSIADAHVLGHLLAQLTMADGSVRHLDTVGMHFQMKY